MIVIESALLFFRNDIEHREMIQITIFEDISQDSGIGPEEGIQMCQNYVHHRICNVQVPDVRYRAGEQEVAYYFYFCSSIKNTNANHGQKSIDIAQLESQYAVCR